MDKLYLDIISNILIYFDIRTLLNYNKINKSFYYTVNVMYSKVNTIDFDRNSYIKINKILNKTINLKKISITRCVLINDSFFNKCSKYLKNVTDLTIINSYYLNDICINIISNNLSNLEKINFSRCKNISDNGLSMIATNCKRIYDINITYCSEITNASLILLCSSLDIKYIDISHCILIDNYSLIYIPLLKINNLITFKCDCCYKISDIGINYIVYNNPNLQNLSISYCSTISNTGFFNNKLSNLQQLDISNLQNISLTPLLNLINLTHLNISSCHNIAEYSVISLLQQNKWLKEFICKYCKCITFNIIQTLIKYNHKLEKLDCSYCYNITYVNIDNILIHLKNIKYISFHCCENINFHVLYYNEIIKNSLEYLDLGYCYNLYSYYLINLINKCNKLETLLLSNCRCINLMVIYSIIKCKYIKKIKLMKNYSINFNLLDLLLNKSNSLEYLYISRYNKNYSVLKNLYPTVKIY